MSGELGLLGEVGDFLFPIVWPAQVAIFAFAGWLLYMLYKTYLTHKGLTPIRIGEILFSLPHERTRFKAAVYQIDRRVDPDFKRDLQNILSRRAAEDHAGDQPALPDLRGPQKKAAILREPEQKGSQYATLADLLDKNKHMQAYICRTLSTEAQNIHGYILLFTNARLDTADCVVNLRDNWNPVKGMNLDFKEASQSTSRGFIIRNPGYKYKNYKLSAMVYYELREIETGTTIDEAKFEQIQVHMSMLTQLEVIVQSWRISKFNERLARELSRANTRLQRFLLILSNRNAELLNAISTEAYDETNIRRHPPALNAMIAAGIMFVFGVVLPEIFRRTIEGPYTDAAYEMLGLSVGFVAVIIAYWWKRSSRT